MTRLPEILRLSDAGQHPDAICAAIGCSLRHVHQVLSEHRPDRARKPTARRSELRATILFKRMVEQKKPAEIVADMAGKCSRAYVYNVLAEEKTCQS